MNNSKIIIVVDDDPAILEMICEGLLNAGFDVVSAMSPEEAMAKSEKIDITFALIDIDLGSPKMNGIQLGNKLKKDIKDIIVIIMTGYHNIKLAVEAMRTNEFDYMIKPFRIDQIISLMERAEREMQVRIENRQLTIRVSDLENQISDLKKTIDELSPDSGNLGQKKVINTNVQKERALRSYTRQK
jgi:two-component system response regulator AtoC